MSSSAIIDQPSSTTIQYVGIMPRPGEPGALCFNETVITKFLKDWERECEEYGLTDAQKC